MVWRGVRGLGPRVRGALRKTVSATNKSVKLELELEDEYSHERPARPASLRCGKPSFSERHFWK